MLKHKLFQPVFSKEPEPGHSTEMLKLSEFIDLLKPEENYYPEDKGNSKILITRIRKIFYDLWGWNTEVIRRATDIATRYEMQAKTVPQAQMLGFSLRKKKLPKKYQPPAQVFMPVYKSTDKVYPERAGQVPEIYMNDNQELILPEGYVCDVGHILTGVDAWSYFAPISPLPNWLMFLRKLFPSCDSNVDFATWLGDVASAAGEFLFIELNNRSAKRAEEQIIIDKYNPASDMLGNIDAYVFIKKFDTKATQNGLLFSEMLYQYYFTENEDRKNRILIFCEFVGLKNWNGTTFENEIDWLKYYKKQLRNATIFYVFGRMETFKGIMLAIKIWLRMYEKELDLDMLIGIMLDALKAEITKK